MVHLRFRPEEYGAIRALCRDIHLRAECFPIFRYFLAEALHERWPTLAGRVALLGERQLRLLFRHLQARQGLETAAGQDAGAAGAHGLSGAEFEAVAQAAQLFRLCGGNRPHFRAFLTSYFSGEAPALAAKLARLSGRALAKLYHRAGRPTRWRAR